MGEEPGNRECSPGRGLARPGDVQRVLIEPHARRNRTPFEPTELDRLLEAVAVTALRTVAVVPQPHPVKAVTGDIDGGSRLHERPFSLTTHSAERCRHCGRHSMHASSSSTPRWTSCRTSTPELAGGHFLSTYSARTSRKHAMSRAMSTKKTVILAI